MQTQILQSCNHIACNHATTELAIMQPCNHATRAGNHATTELAIMQPYSLKSCDHRACNYVTRELVFMQPQSLQSCNHRACNTQPQSLQLCNQRACNYAIKELAKFSRISNILMIDICNNESACKHSSYSWNFYFYF